jgi:nondiscriminating glutamyl-tRNA synthetase
MNQKVRVRFAPSPTGSLHLGGARTALYNYAFARHYGGQFILRVEDTDQERSSQESQSAQIQELQWLGFEWDEGPDKGGDFGPYQQSMRLEIYQKHAQTLLDLNLAYHCFLTDDEIDKLREESRQWQSPYRDLPSAEAKERVARGEQYTIRFRLPEQVKSFTIQDHVRGEVTLSTEGLSDFVILRDGGMPVYNFCCVCDDHLMQISHVFRGEEHLPNTLKQLLLYEALSWQAPEFGHLSIIVNEERKKLSKRDGAVSVDRFRAEGYLPDALLNGIALLGWSHPEAKDIFSKDELIEVFDGRRLGASSAYFDRDKIRWTNAEYIRQLDAAELWTLLRPYCDNLSLPEAPDWPLKALGVYQSELQVLSDINALLRPFSAEEFSVDPAVAEIFTWEGTAHLYTSWAECLAAAGAYLTEDEFLTFTQKMKTDGIKGKALFMPLRAALIGKLQGAEMKMLVELLPKNELQRRLSCVQELA